MMIPIPSALSKPSEVDPVPDISSEPRQLVFDLPQLDAFEAEDFLVSRCNQAAVDLIGQWPQWPGHAVIIAGPAGSGKSHLVSVWRQRSDGLAVAMADLTAETALHFARTRKLAIEDVAGMTGDPEQILFHLLNQAREGGQLLLTMRQPPGQLEIALPDLRSRLRALPVAQIDAIDDALLSGLLVKLFADRQLSIDPGVVKYLTLRIERSAAVAQDVVARIDRLALTTHRKVSRVLASEALASVDADGE